jgi:DNA (cytosine-5)-methyltransferase 1
MFVFENVMGIRDAKGGGPFQDLKKRVRALGYEIEDRTQIASDFGVLQKRERVIIIGWRKENENGNSTSYHYPELRVKPSKYQVMKDLFADLPIRNAGEGTMNGIVNYTKGLKEMPYLKESGIRGKMSFTTEHVVRPLNDNDREIYLIAVNLWKEGVRLHYAKLPERLQKHKNKHKFSNRFCVVNPNGVSHTLVAHIAMDGHYYIYPVEKPTLENVRSISVREAARIQTFPDDFFFEGPRTAVLKQIGNAVPVLLAYEIAKELKQQL